MPQDTTQPTAQIDYPETQRVLHTIEPPYRAVQGFAHSEKQMKGIVGRLIERSAWFEIEPWPDDVWRITMKAENAQFLSQLLAGIGAINEPAWVSGYDSYKASTDKKYENPFDDDRAPENHQLWAEGWFAAKYNP